MDPKIEEAASEEHYEVLAVGQGRKAAGVVSVRLGPEEMDILMRAANEKGRTLSETLRLGLHCLANQSDARKEPTCSTFLMRNQLSRSYTEAGTLKHETGWHIQTSTYGGSVR
jgi:hypothetical protein